MGQPSLIVIGAGIAGLSAGSYAQMNGFRTSIFEMHDKPGGLCTAWRRQGYTIDGCLHWLAGSTPGSGLSRLWEELGVFNGTTMLNFDEFVRVESAEGKTFVLYTDMDRLERHMNELAPEDRATTHEFIQAVRLCAQCDIPIDKAPELSGPLDALKMFVKYSPFFRVVGKWNRVSIQDFAGRFKNAFLGEALQQFFVPFLPMSFMIVTLAWLHLKAAGFPLGGSLAFARAIEKRYRSLGGETRYHSRVSNVLVENNRAVGVRLTDGSEHRADYVVSAADGYTTIFGMLGGAYADRKVRGYYQKIPVFPSIIQVALGVARSFDDMPPSVAGINFPVAPLAFDGALSGATYDRMCVHIYNFDPALAPSGKSVMKVLLPADYNYWNALREDPARYDAEKNKVADSVIALLDKRFPGTAAKVEMRDVATPATYHRYTGNWQGSFEGWMISPSTWSWGKGMRKTLPGLRNFYMAGQWVEPGGGVPPAALSGRNVVQLICKQERKTFIAVS